jgi:hypothetical protein
MATLPNRCPIGPIARLGQRRREALIRQLRLEDGERLVLVALGGIDTAFDLSRWPHLPGVRYLVSRAWQSRRADATAWEDLGLPFIDLLASCDVVVTKPGYGTFTECACNAIPVLYVARRDWPEEPYLTTWLVRHGRAREVTRFTLETGELGDDLAALAALPTPPPPVPSGAAEAAEYLAGLLGG